MELRGVYGEGEVLRTLSPEARGPESFRGFGDQGLKHLGTEPYKWQHLYTTIFKEGGPSPSFKGAPSNQQENPHVKTPANNSSLPTLSPKLRENPKNKPKSLTTPPLQGPAKTRGIPLKEPPQKKKRNPKGKPRRNPKGTLQRNPT